jgi:isocitrate/isopropylmalate dehydrogenase
VRRCPKRFSSEIRGHDAILLGAIGDPSVPPGVLERGILLKFCFELDHYVNLRPVRLFAGVARRSTSNSAGLPSAPLIRDEDCP